MKKLLIFFALIFALTALSGCAPLNAQELASKISTDYSVKSSLFGTDFREFYAETKLTIKYDNTVNTEQYSIYYNYADGKNWYYIKSDRSANPYTFSTDLWETYYYNGRYVEYLTENGLKQVHVSARNPSNVLGGGDHFKNFTASAAKYSMPAEPFDLDTLQDISARRSGTRIILTAKGKEDSLEQIRTAYYPTLVSGDFTQAAYHGNKKVIKDLESIDYTYVIKKERIISKTVVLVGTIYSMQGAHKTGTITHEVIYGYSTTTNIPAELM